MPLVFAPHPAGWETALEAVRVGARPARRGTAPEGAWGPAGVAPPTGVVGPLPVRVCSASRLLSPAGRTARWRYILLDGLSVIGTADLMQPPDGPSRLVETTVGAMWENALTGADALLETRTRRYAARVVELPELRLTAFHLAASRRANDLFLAVGAVFWPFEPWQWYAPDAFRLRVESVARSDRAARRTLGRPDSAFLANPTQPA